MGIPKQLSMLVALTKILTLFESPKIITFSHLNYINFNHDFKDNLMQKESE